MRCCNSCLVSAVADCNASRSKFGLQVRVAASVSSLLEAEKGRRRVSPQYRQTPAPKTSTSRPYLHFPDAEGTCSGAAQPAEPDHCRMTSPGARDRASPKSASTASPSLRIMTLAHFTSRWMIRRSCMNASAASTPCIMQSRLASGNLPILDSNCHMSPSSISSKASAYCASPSQRLLACRMISSSNWSFSCSKVTKIPQNCKMLGWPLHAIRHFTSSRTLRMSFFLESSFTATSGKFSFDCLLDPAKTTLKPPSPRNWPSMFQIWHKPAWMQPRTANSLRSRRRSLQPLGTLKSHKLDGS
mmetsp:Transcript_64517/g.116049  ORF Transcript_64517/g.116049 Transcript_64517/m.116049 type:complete len:301 (-) Transcript_64517:562-1464(-)